MTIPDPVRMPLRDSDDESSTTSVRPAVAAAIRLALGTPRPEDRFAHWPTVLRVSLRELLAPLAWARSRHFIRDAADAETAAAWRRAAAATHFRGLRQLETLRQTLTELHAGGIDVVVLKGLPLGARLYGDAFLRCSSDIDLYVPAARRGSAAFVLGSLGWTREDGSAPWHEAWTRRVGEEPEHLELHSSLVCDHLAHLSLREPTQAPREVAGLLVPALDGPFHSAYLAAHLATHQMPPLLWVVDFATLWAALSDDERVVAARAAASSRLGRYLSWAMERAAALRAVADGRDERLDALGFANEGRRDVHSVARHLALAASAMDRVRVLGAFAVPRRTRGSLTSFVRYTVARIRTRLASLAGVERSYGSASIAGLSPESPAENGYGRPLRVERDDMVSLVRDVVRHGRTLRIRAPGGSMRPTIARGALVRIGGIPAGGVACGDVVLALTAEGEPVLHRVISIGSDTLVMRGDAALVDDPPVPLSRAIGVATHVVHGGVERPLARRSPRSLSVAALKLRRRFARVVRRRR